jgi:phage terminase small subunit
VTQSLRVTDSIITAGFSQKSRDASLPMNSFGEPYIKVEIEDAYSPKQKVPFRYIQKKLKKEVAKAEKFNNKNIIRTVTKNFDKQERSSPVKV